MKDALRIEGLTVRYGGHVAVRDVSLALAPGERLALIGDNGAGKTTLLDAIGGQIPASAGTIRLGGRPVTDLSAHRRARLGLARTFQHLGLVPSLTAAENVALGLDVAGPDAGGSSTARAEQILARAGLPDRARAPASALTPSEGKTVALLRALATKPRVLLLDEPGAGLDPAGKARLLAHLEGIDDAPAVVLVEHDLDLAARFCPRALRLQAGEAAVELSTARAADQPAQGDGGEATPFVGRRPPALCVRGLRMARFGLSGVDLELGRGEIVRVVGGAGAGKSALAAALAGTRPYSGQVELHDRPLAPGRPDARARAGLRVLARGGGHFGALSVRESLELGGWGQPRAEVERLRAAAQADFPILAERADTAAEVLSGGERRLLALARAMMGTVRVLVLDEPTAGLDASRVEAMSARLQSFADGGGALLILEQTPRLLRGREHRRLRLRGGHLEPAPAGG